MISMLREKLALLAQELNASVTYNLDIRSDNPNGNYPYQTERHQIYADGYKRIYRISAGQIMNLKKEDFVKEGEADAGDL